MKNLVLSQRDLGIQEVDLSEVKGGTDVDHSGSGKDGRTGKNVNEYVVTFEDGSFHHVFIDIL